MALSILPHLMTTAAKKNQAKGEIVILTATSGDTGKAALAGFADVPGTRIIVFYPKNGVSPVQEKRMVTQKGGSAEVAVSGTLDSVSEKNGWCTMILTGVEVEDESVRKVLISCKRDLLEKYEEKVLPPCGSQIHLTGTAEFLEEARNPGQFSYRMYYRGLGIRNRVTADRIFISEGKSSPLRSQAECFRAYATAVFQEICVPEDAGIFQAILLGDKSGLSEELRERFQDNGIAHILAVSGLHVSLIGMSVYSALRFWGISYGWAGLGASALLTFYGFVM